MTFDDTPDFDREVLLRVDRPRALPPEADARVRRAMLDAFREASGDDAETADAPDAAHRPPLSVVPLADAPSARPADRRRSRWLVAAVAAAAVTTLLVAGIALLRGTSDEVAPTAPGDEADRAAVTAFCNAEFNPTVRDVADFLADGRPEPLQRALGDIELATQAYADLAARTGAPLAATIRTTADDLLRRAAAVRRAGATQAELEAIAGDLAAAVAALPGSRPCATDELGGTG